jgi:hypothetical protein
MGDNLQKPQKVKPHFYACCFAELQKIARKLGYNLVIHGSMDRDMDLVAIPWVDEPKSHIELIESFVDYFGAYKYIEDDIERKKLLYCYSILGGGRSSYIINLNRGGKYNSYVDAQYYLDISITPLSIH